jgi:hypothetical protein
MDIAAEARRLMAMKDRGRGRPAKDTEDRNAGAHALLAQCAARGVPPPPELVDLIADCLKVRPPAPLTDAQQKIAKAAADRPGATNGEIALRTKTTRQYVGKTLNSPHELDPVGGTTGTPFLIGMAAGPSS